MKQAARIASAIDLLTRIEMARIPMDNTIRDYMNTRRFIGSKDRTEIVERIYRVMRARARTGWWLEQAGVEATGRSRALADLVFQGETAEAIENYFSGAKHEPSPLEEKERGLVAFLEGKTLDDAAMPVDVRAECPDWAVEKLQALYGEEFEARLKAMIDPAPMDLRVNTLKGSVEKAIDVLKADRVKVSRTEFSPFGLRVEGKPFMSMTKAFRSGLVEIQDEGSQLIALACDAKPGMRVLDFCAGGGGKTLALAAMMENKGNLVAVDIDARRLEKGRPRYRKAGVHNVELRCLKEEQSRKWLRRQKEAMDVVLVDAPCSSSGTWRRNPDLRWKWYGPSFEEILELQSSILDRVADKVKPGGRLVYATCSLFREENEGQVEAFLARHEGFSVLPVAEAMQGALHIPACEGPYMRLFPSVHGTDGFFAAVLIKS
jgi:16S rRNA (cytosine967-C5)-methyltransferase